MVRTATIETLACTARIQLFRSMVALSSTGIRFIHSFVRFFFFFLLLRVVVCSAVFHHIIASATAAIPYVPQQQEPSTYHYPFKYISSFRSIGHAWILCFVVESNHSTPSSSSSSNNNTHASIVVVVHGRPAIIGIVWRDRIQDSDRAPALLASNAGSVFGQFSVSFRSVFGQFSVSPKLLSIS